MALQTRPLPKEIEHYGVKWCLTDPGLTPEWPQDMRDDKKHETKSLGGSTPEANVMANEGWGVKLLLLLLLLLQHIGGTHAQGEFGDWVVCAAW